LLCEITGGFMAKYRFMGDDWGEFESPQDFIETSTAIDADRDGERFIDDAGNTYEFFLVTTEAFRKIDT